ncbi:prolyl-tRNA synthetase associated domain-containing protein [Xanthobacter versatilis]|uniref:prolyl-tRNA synthetase associated domain-containing protein n=1 Tax=Xanthobacter autotrophicus (strain ATCC BAA-1158 / Py2) TaxID=78245 RepID=UPI0037282D65
MPLTPDALLDLLAANGIAATTHAHPPVHTVAESQALRGDIPGAHTKNLFLRDGKKTYFLVAIAEDTPVNLKALKAPLGAKGSLSFGSAEALYEHLGVLPGSVTLLAAANDAAGLVTIAIDAALLKAEAVCCHPLTNERTTSLTPQALDAFFRLTGHEPLVIEIPPAPEA